MEAEVREYTVMKSGRIQGVWRDEGDIVKLTGKAAKYPLMSGQIIEKKAAKKDK